MKLQTGVKTPRWKAIMQFLITSKEEATIEQFRL